MLNALRRMTATTLIASIGSIVTLPVAAATEERALGPGDEIEITVINQPDTLIGHTQRITLGLEGTVSLPLVGTIQVTGKPIGALAQQLQASYRKLFAYAFVGVQLLKAGPPSGSNAVYVTGQVKQVGALTPAYGATFNLVSLLGQAGGPLAGDADAEHVRIYRVAGGVEEVNFEKAMRDGSGQKIILQPGDTVEVPASWSGMIKQQQGLAQAVMSFISLATVVTTLILATQRGADR